MSLLDLELVRAEDHNSPGDEHIEAVRGLGTRWVRGEHPTGFPIPPLLLRGSDDDR
jgi:hypothetical protein